MKKKNHPYYDSDRKKRTEEFALKATVYSFIVLIVVIIIEWLWL